MGRKGKLNTRRGMGSSAEGRVQHSKEMSWQTRQKTSGLVRVGIIFYIYRNISSFYTRQYLRQEHRQHSIYPHTIIGSSGDTM